jgi:predicted ATPase
MPPTVIKPLSCVLQNKTGGGIIFVLNFFKSLHEERLIYFNLTSLRWEFNVNKIIQKEVSGDIM